MRQDPVELRLDVRAVRDVIGGIAPERVALPVAGAVLDEVLGAGVDLAQVLRLGRAGVEQAAAVAAADVARGLDGEGGGRPGRTAGAAGQVRHAQANLQRTKVRSLAIPSIARSFLPSSRER